MSVNAAVFQRVQLGAEVTPGTLVAASKRLGCTMFRPVPRVPLTPFRPVGSKFPTAQTKQKEWTAFEYSGDIGYVDMLYILNSLLKKVAGGTPTFIPDTWGPDSIQTYTMEHGSSLQAQKFGFGVISAMALTFSNTEASLRGSGFGQAMAGGITMTAAPTDVPVVPVDPASIDLYVGDTVAGLALVQRGLGVTLNFADKVGPAFFLKSSVSSFEDVVERPVTYGINLSVEHNSTAEGYMADLRAAKKKFLRIKCTGPEYGVGTPYLLQITCPFEFQNPDRPDVQDIYTDAFPVVPVNDATFGGAIEVVLNTGQTGL